MKLVYVILDGNDGMVSCEETTEDRFLWRPISSARKHGHYKFSEYGMLVDLDYMYGIEWEQKIVDKVKLMFYISKL